MKRDSLMKLVLPVFLAAVAAYAIAFKTIEHRRVRKGPWRVAFENAAGTPTLRINQHFLGITNVVIFLANQSFPHTNFTEIREFAHARSVPFPVPFGQCVFQDTLFLPGTVALDLFGHQIQMIPRTLTIDGVEHPWRSNEAIRITTKTNLPSTTK